MKADLDTRIGEMDFSIDPWGQRMSTRIKNALQRHGIMTLGQLVRTDRDDLPPGLSIVSKLIIDAKLEPLGFKLPRRRKS